MGASETTLSRSYVVQTQRDLLLEEFINAALDRGLHRRCKSPRPRGLTGAPAQLHPTLARSYVVQTQRDLAARFSHAWGHPLLTGDGRRRAEDRCYPE